MSTSSRAAVLTATGAPLEIATVALAPPKPHEVLVEIKASGVCHSDLLIRDNPGTPKPAVLGHEGSGIVAEVGAAVTSLRPGDRVALNWNPYCGKCLYCAGAQVFLCEEVDDALRAGTLSDGTSRLSLGGAPIHHATLLSTFSEFAVVHEMSCVRLPADMPLVQASLLGCAVPTGFGAAVHSAGLKPGSSVAVFGCGGVGINAVQGARLAGASHIIAVDIKDANLAVARRFGATDTVNAAREDAAAFTRAATSGKGADAAIDTTGSVKATWDAFEATRNGGTIVVVGRYTDEAVSVNARMFHRKGKILRGSLYGDINPLVDIPRLARLYLDGKLLLDELVVETIALEEVNAALDAFHDTATANVGHRVITF